MRYFFLLLMSFNLMAHEEMNNQCGSQEKVAEAKRLFNKIKWKTASEQDNFGYDIYRSDSEDGEYIVVNEDIIEGAGTTSNSTKYEFHDDTINPCKKYFYYIESISMSGTREAFTPKFQSKLKLDPKQEVKG